MIAALDYNRLIIEANRLGRVMRLLHDQVKNDMGAVLDEGYDDELDKLAEKLWGIGSVLTLLRETPNAHINAEAMAALRSEVEAAAKIEQSSWARDILADVPGERF